MYVIEALSRKFIGRIITTHSLQVSLLTYCTLTFIKNWNTVLFHISSSKKQVIGARRTKYPRELNSFKFDLVNAEISFLTWCMNDFMVSDFQTYFSLAQSFGQPNDVLISADVKGMLECKDYNAVDIVFSFNEVFTDHANGKLDEPKLRSGLTLYLDLVDYLMFNLCNVIKRNLSRYKLNEKIYKLKTNAKGWWAFWKTYACLLLSAILSVMMGKHKHY